MRSFVKIFGNHRIAMFADSILRKEANLNAASLFAKRKDAANILTIRLQWILYRAEFLGSRYRLVAFRNHCLSYAMPLIFLPWIMKGIQRYPLYAGWAILLTAMLAHLQAYAFHGLNH